MLDIYCTLLAKRDASTHIHTHTHEMHTYITHSEIHQRHADETLKEKKRPFIIEMRILKKKKKEKNPEKESTTSSELHTCQGESLAAGGMCQSKAPV